MPKGLSATSKVIHMTRELNAADHDAHGAAIAPHFRRPVSRRCGRAKAAAPCSAAAFAARRRNSACCAEEDNAGIDAAGVAGRRRSRRRGGPARRYILDCAATVVTGGTLVRPADAKPGAATIDTGVTRRVARGDVVVIPAGTPNGYKDVDESVTCLEFGSTLS